jgi:hypothetical protein
MYKKRLEPSNPPELKSIYDDDLEKSVFDNALKVEEGQYKSNENKDPNSALEAEERQESVLEGKEGQNSALEAEERQESILEAEERQESVLEGEQGPNSALEAEEGPNSALEAVKEGQDKSNEGKEENNDSDVSNGSSITFNRIKKKVFRKYLFLKNKIKTSSIDYKLDLINDAINNINGRINLLEIKVNNLELDVNKNKTELMEYDRLTSIEMTNINDKLNNANIIILD